MKTRRVKFIECLSNIVDNRGKTCPTDTSGIPLIATNCIKTDFLYPVFENIRFVNKETYCNWFRAHPQPGDILFVTKGSPGRTAWVPNPINFCIAQDMLAIRAKKDIIDSKFLFALLRSKKVQEDIENLHVGTLIPHFKKGDFDQLYLDIPMDFDLQKKIGEIYFNFSQKIEINRHMSQTLEHIAATLFKKYFVDGIDPDNLPDGWSIQILLDHFEVDKGLSYKGSGLTTKDNGIPMHNLNSVYEGGGYKYEGIKYYSGEYKEKHHLRPWDIIVANTEQGHKYLLIGYPAVVPSTYAEPGIFTHHIYRLRAKDNTTVSNQYLYYLLLQPYVREQVIGCTNGTTVNMLYAVGLQKPKFILPPTDLIAKFSEIINPIWRQKENLHKQNENLTAIRDTLLPKLMSGEINLSAIHQNEQLHAEVLS